MALMIVAVAISLLIGIPLGILSGARTRKFDGAASGFLDAAQTMPAYCYLLSRVLLFDIGAPAAVIATVIFALPPARAPHAHGIRAVPVGLSRSARPRCDRRQVLGKIQWPLARPADPARCEPGDHDGFRHRRHRRADRHAANWASHVLAGLQKLDVGAGLLRRPRASCWSRPSLDRITTGGRANGAPRCRRGPVDKRRELLLGSPSSSGHRRRRIAGAEPVPVVAGRSRCGESVNDVVEWLHDNVRNGRSARRRHAAHQRLPGRDDPRPDPRVPGRPPWWFVVAVLCGRSAWLHGRPPGRRSVASGMPDGHRRRCTSGTGPWTRSARSGRRHPQRRARHAHRHPGRPVATGSTRSCARSSTPPRSCRSSSTSSRSCSCSTSAASRA